MTCVVAGGQPGERCCEGPEDFDDGRRGLLTLRRRGVCVPGAFCDLGSGGVLPIIGKRKLQSERELQTIFRGESYDGLT